MATTFRSISACRSFQRGFALDNEGTLIDVSTGEPVPLGTAILEGVSIGQGPFPGTPVGFEPLSDLSPSDWLRTSQMIEAPGGGVFTLAAWTPIETVTRGITRLVLVLAIVVPSLVLLGGLSLWLALGAALRPVRLISDEAKRIAPSNSGRRLPVPDSGDEIAALTRTLNDMLDRLDSGLVRQRQFVSDASHELRSPLTAVKASAELALLDDTIGPSTNESLEAVQRGADRLEDVLDDLTQLASDDVSTMMPTDIDALVSDEVAQYQRESPHVLFDGGSISPVSGEVHPTRVARAISNLFDNAVRHAFTTIAVSTSMEDGHVVIVVEDDGAGVPLDRRDAIFERFVRFDEGRSRARGGSGLGLALAATIAADHSGRISCDTSSLGGERFTLLLPCP
jgi:signal transduction histidine kinase